MGKTVDAIAITQASDNNGGLDQDDGGGGGGVKYLYSGYIMEMVAVWLCVVIM